MKHAKSAALVAGSMMALGTAAPAFAAGSADAPEQPSFSLNGGINDGLERGLNNEVTQKQLDGRQLAPLTDPVNNTVENVKGGVSEASDTLGQAPQSAGSASGQLLGGLPLR